MGFSKYCCYEHFETGFPLWIWKSHWKESPRKTNARSECIGASRFPKLQYIRLCCIHQCRLTLPHMHANTCRKCLRTCFYFCESSRGEIVAQCGDLFVCFVCVCTCASVSVCVCTCSCASVSVCVCVPVHVSLWVCVCMFMCLCAYVCIHVHVPLCVYMFMCLCVYTCPCACVHVCAHMWRPKINFQYLPLSITLKSLHLFILCVCIYVGTCAPRHRYGVRSTTFGSWISPSLTQISRLGGKTLYPWVILLALYFLV